MIKTCVIGRLTADPTIQEVNGVQCCNFTVAADAPYKTDDGERATEFWRISAWRQLGENCAKYLKKGSSVYAYGNPRANIYTDRNNNPQIGYSLSATEINFMSPPKGDDSRNTQERTPQRKRQLFDD